ncbi:MAG: ROK family protein [Limnochordia bacterium]|jgi:predicted NBD/HSP70 family sugar kinase
MRHHGMNSQDNRDHNRAALLSLVRSHGPISRSELARRSGLSKPVVTEIVDSLINANLIYESYKAKSGVGRRPVMLEINQDSLHMLGIDLARTHVEFMVTDLTGNSLKTVRRPLNTESDEFSTLELTRLLAATTKKLMAEYDIIGIGIAHPRPLSSRKRIVVGSEGQPGWIALDVQAALSQETNVPIFVGNDADVAGLYEKWFGAARDLHDFIYVMVGEGVGAGIFCAGALLLGSRGMAGEFGHIKIKSGERECLCGGRGCLETELALPVLLEKASEALGRPLESVEQLSAALEEGTGLVKEVFHGYARTMAIHVGNLINIFDPAGVIMGGEIAHLGKYLEERLHQELGEVVHPLLRDGFTLRFSAAADNMVAKGASILVQEHFFAYPHKYIAEFRG